MHTRASAAPPPLQWAGRTWNITTGGMAGVAEGSASNVSVDDNGYLHLKISKSGDTWTAAELFTTERLGFGSYQWQIDAPIDRFDPNVVLGLYPYGPAAGIGSDGTNEIDIEYSFWGDPNSVNGDWTDYPASGKTIGEKSYKFSLSGGTLSTSRFVWSSSQIESALFAGLTAVGSATGLLESWTYAPNDATINIPQQALPLGMNLWCFENPPSDGKEVEVVIRDFQFVPEGANAGGAGAGAGRAGAGGAGAGAGRAGSGGAGSGGSDANNVGGSSGSVSATSGAAGAQPVASSGAGAVQSDAGAPSHNAGASTSDTAGAAVDLPDSAQHSSCSVGHPGDGGNASWFALLLPLTLGAWRRRRSS